MLACVHCCFLWAELTTAFNVGPATPRARPKLEKVTDRMSPSRSPCPKRRGHIILSATGEPRSISREMLAIGLPALLGFAIEPVASLVDTAFVGRLCGTADLAGAGVAIAVFNLLAKMFNFLSPATTSLVAAAAGGAADRPPPRGSFTPPMARVATSSLAVAFAIGSCLSALILALAAPLLTALGVPLASALRRPARAYLAARAVGAPATLMLLALQGAFRGARDTTTPLRALCLATVVNLALDPLLVAQRGLGWGVAGAAAATSASNIAAALVLTRALASRCADPAASETRGGARPLRVFGLPPPSIAECKRVALAGSFLTLRTLGVVGTLSYSSIAAGKLGATAGAAHQVCSQLWFATSLLADAVAVAAQSLLARCLAASDRLGAISVIRQSLFAGMLVGLVAMGGMLLGGKALCALFTSDPDVLSAALAIWPLVVWSLPLNTMAFTIDGILYGATDFQFCALMMACSSVPAVAAMALGARRHGLAAVWGGLALLMGLRSVFGVARITSRRGPWAALRPPLSPPPC
ncbi:hypothetical protein AB1Y20_005614 [Prymnesium parvum]|uniref:Protein DETOXIFICATION n=1 Tax=Prymnesium parvum TaxID=97485 RepID=A0AB34J6X9_PRYPA